MVLLIRHQVARINICLFCIDIARSFTIKASMNEAKFDALEQYRTSELFTETERAALDYVTELTKEKKVDPDTFARMSRHYSEREICEIVWLVASEHLYNMTNIGLNIHSDMLCDISRKRQLRYCMNTFSVEPIGVIRKPRARTGCCLGRTSRARDITVTP